MTSVEEAFGFQREFEIIGSDATELNAYLDDHEYWISVSYTTAVLIHTMAGSSPRIPGYHAQCVMKE